jgi:hypothetical protein
MQPEASIAAIAHVIQLSIAPVFLISGVATLLSVLTNRLGRIVDRARAVEANLDFRDDTQKVNSSEELIRLSKRARLVNFSITFSTICAVLICITIATLFLGTFLPIHLSKLITVQFIAAMFSLFVALMTFLSEILTAARALRISPGPKALSSSPAKPHLPVVEE